MRKIFHKNVVTALQVLADRDFQYRSWVLGDVTAGESSYGEAICQLFDDTFLGQALDVKGSPIVYDEYTDALLRKLDALCTQIDSEQEPALLIDSPQMITLRKLAREALQSLLLRHSNLLE